MEKLTRENAKKVVFYAGTLDKCVERLIQYREMGQSVVFEFNGHPLYSCDVTMDSAYLEVTGQTKAEFDESRKRWREECIRKEKIEIERAEAKKPDWIERGRKIIYPEKIEKWKEYMDCSIRGIYHGAEIETALGLIEKLEAGASIEEVEKELDAQNHSGTSHEIVRLLILHFSKKGPEFYEKTCKLEMDRKTRMEVERVRRENAELQKKEEERRNKEQRTPEED